MPKKPAAKKTRSKNTAPTATIIARGAHNISRANISKYALKVLYRLHEAGYQAYLVGGCVRDLLLERTPKDFDVTTDAHPEQIKKLFRNSMIIGRRFRLIHVRFGQEIIEVATFRGGVSKQNQHLKHTAAGMIVRDNVYGTMAEDALRRDFTINALYYNIADFSVIDHVDGMADHKKRLLRMIGEPVTRYQEDPVRLLRAIRLSAKCDFTIESKTAAPIAKNGQLLLSVPRARLFDEINKMFFSGYSVEILKRLQAHQLFELLFPQTQQLITQHQKVVMKLINQGCANTDLRIVQGKRVIPAFMFAVILWYPLQQAQAQYQAQGLPLFPALRQAVNDIIARQVKHLAITKRASMVMREIWGLQLLLERHVDRRALRMVHRPRFRAAYDFLLLRAQIDESVRALADWWTRFQIADKAVRQSMMAKRHSC